MAVSDIRTAIMSNGCIFLIDEYFISKCRFAVVKSEALV